LIVPFTMRVDQRPFSDVRVRQAMRYIVDRPQMLETLFGGYGKIANDLYGSNDPDYDHSIPQRVQDIPRAKSLLKAAGYENLTTTLVTAPIFAQATGAATVFAQQAKAAGVNVLLDSIPVSTLYGPSYLKWTFAQDFWEPLYYLTMAGESSIATAPYNETHFSNARFTSLYRQALSTLDQNLQREIVHEMQWIEWNEGGYIIPYLTPFLDAHSPKLKGVLPGKELPLGNLSFKNYWFE
jgi:peptide/nickel transport system substrate-binding protein